MIILKSLKLSLPLLKRIADAKLLSVFKSELNHIYITHKFATKPHCNVGTIGHIDHGKTTLTSAITKVLAEKGKSKYMAYDQIDRAPEEKARGITINACHVEYETEHRHYAHTDCPGHIDFIKNMIVGTSQLDGVILVVAASEGTMPQTREHLLLAKQIGVDDLIVYINKTDLVDKDTRELVEMEVEELLQEVGFDPKKVPFIHGSALCALNNTHPTLGRGSIEKLLGCMDGHVRLPERNQNNTFTMPITSAFTVPGRGTVVVGTVQEGCVCKGDQIFIKGFGNNIKTAASDLQIFNKPTPKAVAGDNVGVLLRGVKREFVERGMFLSGGGGEGGGGGVEQVEVMEAQLYVQTKEEGGRSKPITSGYAATMFVDTWNIQCMIHLDHMQEDIQADKKKQTEILKKTKNKKEETKILDKTDPLIAMPGDIHRAVVYLRKAMVVREGQRFFVRENNLTTITGVVTKVDGVEIFPGRRVDIKGFNYTPPSSHKIEGNSSVVMRRRMKTKGNK